MSKHTIQVYERSVYGRQTIYPVGPDGALLSSLTGKKTLSPCDIRNLQGLGFEIEYVADPESQQALRCPTPTPSCRSTDYAHA
jgi:hypothetical protein